MIAQPAHKILSIALAITVLCMIAACASQPPEDKDTRTPSRTVSRAHVPSVSVGARAAAVALRQVGVPYRYGGSSRSGFDCSGLVQYSYQHVGKQLPRTTGQLWSSSRAVRREDLQEGDLVFFSIEGKMSHVGLYLGGQRFVHAPSSGRTVTVATLNSPFYSSAFLRGGRPR